MVLRRIGNISVILSEARDRFLDDSNLTKVRRRSDFGQIVMTPKISLFHDTQKCCSTNYLKFERSILGGLFLSLTCFGIIFI